MLRLLAVTLAILVSGGLSRAEEPKSNRSKEHDERVRESLKIVHNKGADLYNETRDFVGTYRLYQGALLAVKPLLMDRPGTQRLIDEGLAAADKDSLPAQKAFKLHEIIEAVRESLKVAEPTKADTSKPVVDPVKPVEKKPTTPSDPVKPVEKKPTTPEIQPKPVQPGAPQLPVAPPPHDKK